METLQIRLPKELLSKVDELVASKLYSSRSEILRFALQDFIRHTNFNGVLPYIVGPFNNIDLKIFDQPSDTFQVKPQELENIRQLFSQIKIE